jgi:hypothetical protein
MSPDGEFEMSSLNTRLQSDVMRSLAHSRRAMQGNVARNVNRAWPFGDEMRLRKTPDPRGNYVAPARHAAKIMPQTVNF